MLVSLNGQRCLEVPLVLLDEDVQLHIEVFCLGLLVNILVFRMFIIGSSIQRVFVSSPAATTNAAGMAGAWRTSLTHRFS